MYVIKHCIAIFYTRSPMLVLLLDGVRILDGVANIVNKNSLEIFNLYCCYFIHKKKQIIAFLTNYLEKLHFIFAFILKCDTPLLRNRFLIFKLFFKV